MSHSISRFSLLFCLIFGVNMNSVADTSSVTEKQREHKQIVDYLMGRFEPAKHPAFTRIPKKYASRKGLYLRTEALNAFRQMHDAAKKQGINLVIKSATRNFSYQRRIWERKWKAKSRSGLNATARALNILQFSSMPGTSRHHWGTDIDINAFHNAWFNSGEGLRLFNWMTKHAAKYGFYRPYTAKNQQRPNGYNEEKWHWSYTPLSIPMLQDASTVLSDHDITGFLGSETAIKIKVKDNYILGVDQSCQ